MTEHRIPDHLSDHDLNRFPNQETKANNRPIPMKTCMPMIVLMVSLASCVPKAEFIQLAEEKELLEKKVANLNDTIKKNGQIEIALATLQKEAQAAKDALTQEKEEALRRAKATAEELEALKQTFEKFKVDRRTGMIGKKLPEVALKGGKSLTNGQIKEVTASTVRFEHSAGIALVRLADLGPDLQWEAVWSEAESMEYEALLAKKSKENSQQFKTYMTVQSALLDTQKLKDVEKSIVEHEKLIGTLRTRLADQRAELNAAYQRMSSQSKSLSGLNWNSGAPEDSEILTNWLKRPAISGFGQLDGLASSVRTTKESGAAATAELGRLKEMLDNSRK